METGVLSRTRWAWVSRIRAMICPPVIGDQVGGKTIMQFRIGQRCIFVRGLSMEQFVNITEWLCIFIRESPPEESTENTRKL